MLGVVVERARVVTTASLKRPSMAETCTASLEGPGLAEHPISCLRDLPGIRDQTIFQITHAFFEAHMKHDFEHRKKQAMEAREWRGELRMAAPCLRAGPILVQIKGLGPHFAFFGVV